MVCCFLWGSALNTKDKIDKEEELHPLNPPGGLMIWMFILMEFGVFASAFVIFLYMKNQEMLIFSTSQKVLNQKFGFFNTLLLITSGYLIALSNRVYEKNEIKRTIQLLIGGMCLGGGFLLLKGVEYAQKIAAGYTTGVNTFFDFYWMMTAFHAAHVLFGLFLLAYIVYKIKKKRLSSSDDLTLKGSSAWWHMCDVIWVILFPLLYLL